MNNRYLFRFSDVMERVAMEDMLTRAMFKDCHLQSGYAAAADAEMPDIQRMV